MSKQKTNRKSSKAKKIEQAKTLPFGWNTSDEDEIKRRIIRAQSEEMKVYNLDSNTDYFRDYKVLSSSRREYIVEIRSLSDHINSCSCTDYDISGLGTCKHIEKVLLILKKKGKSKFTNAAKRGNSRFEIYVHPKDNKIKILYPEIQSINDKIYKPLSDLFSADRTLIADGKTAIPVLKELIANITESEKKIRLSTKIDSFLENDNDFIGKQKAKEFFLQDVNSGKTSLDIMKLPLYDYQKTGMLHLAFTERAILADEMGLGKTVQAVAACELLQRIRNISKVLVISPTSLKSEWEEQIVKFSDLPAIIIYGNKKLRLHQYQKESFFYLVNYEQVLRDHEHIQRLIDPDVIILDEAQRIKNWQTQTAVTIKNLYSPYAFVLTGTPIENRIDDIYSIMQFLDPKFFGSLFRFNREYYRLDEKGKPIGYKNLDTLHRKLKPVLLRRLKEDVEGQLPGRTINNYFVQMSNEQNERYKDYEDTVARLASAAQRRPLTKEEFEHLQQSLAAMRMLCDTPYIMDEECRICPKLREVENILEELFQDKDTKIIIFSEWVRMLHLITELLKHMEIKFAWHTGEIDQKKRRSEINYFKNDKECRVFLSTDSGSVGLNLQIANVVINIDLPWNPARLEQRIARAWRKHQTRTVQIINLISENTIEHRMLALLDHKRSLADSVLDSGDHDEIQMLSGRVSLMNKLNTIIGHSVLPTIQTNAVATEKQQRNSEPLIKIKDEIIACFKQRIYRIDYYQKGNNTKKIVLVIIDGDIEHPKEKIQNIVNRITQDKNIGLELKILDRGTYEMLQSLSSNGIISFNQKNAKSLYQSGYISSVLDQNHEAERRCRKEAQSIFQQADRKQSMASILIENGFYEESINPLNHVLELSLKSVAIFVGYETESDNDISVEVLNTKLADTMLPEDTEDLIKTLNNLTNDTTKTIDKNTAGNLLTSVQVICRTVKNMLNKINP